MNRNIFIPRDKIADFCQRHYIRRLAIFGSALREDFAPGSDVDVLVEFIKGQEPGLAFFDMEAELSELLGRKVDLNTPNFLSHTFAILWSEKPRCSMSKTDIPPLITQLEKALSGA